MAVSLIFSSTLYAATDVQLKMTTTNGSTTVDFKDLAGNPQVTVNSDGAAVFNERGNSAADFRIEGDTIQHLLFVKASTDNVGVGTSSPHASAILDVSSTTKALWLPYFDYCQDSTCTSGMMNFDASDYVYLCENGTWNKIDHNN